MSSTRRREADHILKLCLGDHLRAYEVIERQLASLMLRAQVLIALSIVVITATGFSGRVLAAASRIAHALVAGGKLAGVAGAGGAGLRGAGLPPPLQEAHRETRGTPAR